MTDYVLVCCKLPGGLICRIDRKVEDYEPLMTGGQRKIEKWVPTGQEFKLNGAPGWPVAGSGYTFCGYGFTQVPRDLWEAWYEQKKEMAVIKNRLIFAASRADEARHRAREQMREGVRSGLEPLDPHHLPKEFTTGNFGGLRMKTADEQAAIPEFDAEAPTTNVETPDRMRLKERQPTK